VCHITDVSLVFENVVFLASFECGVVCARLFYYLWGKEEGEKSILKGLDGL